MGAAVPVRTGFLKNPLDLVDLNGILSGHPGGIQHSPHTTELDIVEFRAQARAGSPKSSKDRHAPQPRAPCRISDTPRTGIVIPPFPMTPRARTVTGNGRATGANATGGGDPGTIGFRSGPPESGERRRLQFAPMGQAVAFHTCGPHRN
ncbi:hypothetical protein GCM10010505_23920 [Kitasatospora aburaviensis]